MLLFCLIFSKSNIPVTDYQNKAENYVGESSHEQEQPKNPGVRSEKLR
jgi:hypothetical protein